MPNRLLDRLLLIVLGFLSLFTLYQVLFQEYFLTLNNYAAFLFLIVAIILKIKKEDRFKSAVLLLLLSASFNFINFSTVTYSATVGYKAKEIDYSLPSINILFFLLLIFYCCINISYVRSIFTGTDDEKELKRQKMIEFYYTKFSGIDLDGFNSALNNFDQYPEEARIALEKLKNERII